MTKKRNYFTIGQYIFWILFGLLGSILFFHFADRMFNSERLAEELVLQETPPTVDTTSRIQNDTSKIAKKDSVKYNWRWQDFNDNKHNITFNVHKLDLKKAADNRIRSSWPTIYDQLYSHDKHLIKGLIGEIDPLETEVISKVFGFGETES
jgi:hypothetical protein